jgi:hypothetical protein
MKDLTRLRWVGVSAAVAALLTGCSSGGGDPATGTLSLSIMDAPVDDASQVWVTFTGVSLKPQGNGSAIDITFPTPAKVDLLSLNADNAETLLDGHVLPAGIYNWLELHVQAEHDGTFDSYAVLQNGGIEEVELEVPSGSVRLVSGLTITANQETSFLIDWNLHEGLVDPVGHSGLFLRPALRVIDMTQYGTLTGTVAMAQVTAAGCSNDLNLDLGNAVYIYAGLNAVPDDFDLTDPQPVATAGVTQDSLGAYVYETLLSPGDYTVAFTCQAIDDLPDADEAIVFVQPTNVTVADGATHTVSF